MLKSVGFVVVGYLIFGISAGLLFVLSGQDPKQAPSIAFMVGSILYGMSFAFIGGWVSAYLAGGRELQHSGGVAGVILTLALISLVIQYAHGSVWSQLATVIFMVPSAVIGGVVRRKQKNSAQAA